MPLVDGLGGRALFQSFASYAEALANYLEAREKDWVRVIRDSGDSDTTYGNRDYAEDL